MTQTNEKLQTKIIDGLHPTGTVTVEVEADFKREEEFDEIRQAVREILEQ